MIGIFGGTFDPVHFGHLRPALDLLQGLGLHEVRLIPCREPPHRTMPMATPAQRLSMLQVAVENVEGLIVDERELCRDGPSYMVDTLLSLREEVGQTPLCLLLGSDAFAGLEDWHQWQRISELAHIVVARRPGETQVLIEDWAKKQGVSVANNVEQLRAQSSGSVFHYDVTQMDISATRIREMIATGEAADFLLPDTVLQMVFQLGLYGAEKTQANG